jgi:hypothetical protein
MSISVAWPPEGAFASCLMNTRPVFVFDEYASGNGFAREKPSIPVGAAIKLSYLDWHIGSPSGGGACPFCSNSHAWKKGKRHGGMALSGTKNSVDGGIHMSL